MEEVPHFFITLCRISVRAFRIKNKGVHLTINRLKLIDQTSIFTELNNKFQ